MGRPCGCCACPCFGWDLDSFHADDWIVVFDAGPYGADAVAFNGTDVTITLDWGNPLRVDGEPVGVTLLRKSWLAQRWDVRCQFYWGIKATMRALNQPPLGCAIGGTPPLYVGVARCPVDLAAETANISSSSQQIAWPDADYEYRLNNATSGGVVLGPQQYGLEQYGFRFACRPLSGQNTGSTQWQVDAGGFVRVGCCELPHYDLPIGFANAGKVFVFKTKPLWTLSNVVLTADPYDPLNSDCDPVQRYRNQPQGAAEVDLVISAESNRLPRCDATQQDTWGGQGNVAIGERWRRWEESLFFAADSRFRRLSVFENADVKAKMVCIVNDHLAAPPLDWLVVEWLGEFPDGIVQSALWNPITQQRVGGWTLNGPNGLHAVEAKICPPNSNNRAGEMSHYGPPVFQCQESPPTYAFYDVESVLQRWANPSLTATISWDRWINRLTLYVGTKAYVADVSQLIGLDASGALVFAEASLETGPEPCNCPLPATLTLKVISMS